jgi:electron transport complex protein RnfB
MSDVYRRLAKKLDDLPNGFPATESGVEIEILKKIYTPEEAEMALKIRPVPETVEAIAQRLGKPVSEMQSILDKMIQKGQIGSFKFLGQQVYMFFPFVLGIYEFQLPRLNREFVDLFEEYAPAFLPKLGGFKPALLRVIPVNTSIDARPQVHLYEDLHRLIDQAKSFRVSECICRKERALQGHGCNHSVENCLNFSSEEGAFDRSPLPGRLITKEEAIQILRQAEKEGLVHSSWNVQKGHSFVCNCCPCCCAIMRGLKEFKAPHILAKSNFVAHINKERCSSCGICREERCPMDAIIEEAGSYRVLADRCIGCGVCTITCPAEAITMKPRPEKEREEPPATLTEWKTKRAGSRGIELKNE